MTWYRVVAMMALAGVAGCQRPDAAPPAEADQSAAADQSATLAASVAVPAYNLGDVDVATVPSVALSGRSRSQYIQYEEMRNLRKELSIANATVLPPFPPELWVMTTIDSAYGYRDTDAVLVRVALMLDTQTEPIVTKDFVWSGKALVTQPANFEVDVMPYLTPLPESVLVQARVTIHWFPDTDAASISPETADLSKSQTHEKRSNPFRINFK